jgi:outer membrane protein TolC
LSALGWVLADEQRGQRLLDLTGLGPDALRAGLRNPAVLAAVLDFLLGHEPDLVVAAHELGIAPEAFAAARSELER